MAEFATERDMFDLMAQKLAASVISDTLDTFGFRDQVMRATIGSTRADSGNDSIALQPDLHIRPKWQGGFEPRVPLRSKHRFLPSVL